MPSGASAKPMTNEQLSEVCEKIVETMDAIATTQLETASTVFALAVTSRDLDRRLAIIELLVTPDQSLVVKGD